MLMLGLRAFPLGAAEAPLSPEDFEGFLLSGFEIRGLPGPMEGELKKGLALAEEKKLLQARTTLFRAADLEQDVERTRLFLARRGYPKPGLPAGSNRRRLAGSRSSSWSNRDRPFSSSRSSPKGFRQGSRRRSSSP